MMNAYLNVTILIVMNVQPVPIIALSVWMDSSQNKVLTWYLVKVHVRKDTMQTLSQESVSSIVISQVANLKLVSVVRAVENASMGTIACFSVLAIWAVFQMIVAMKSINPVHLRGSVNSALL